ncbi:hypothetical protein Lal_00026256 [Lupinus albus]|nr:hypothetical protein Lal_00026256 [Lupinus albus]
MSFHGFSYFENRSNIPKQVREEEEELETRDLTLSLKRGILAQARISQCQQPQIAISRPGETTLAQAKILQRQFPIIISYAMTINKSQGQSLERVELYLPKLVFSHGQLYVAISRVKSNEGLKILIHDNDSNSLKSTTNYFKIFNSHGQLYVAISRVKSNEGLKILIHDKDSNSLKSTTNVIYKEYVIKFYLSHGQLYVAISRVKINEGSKILIHDKDGNSLKSTINVIYKEIFQNL